MLAVGTRTVALSTTAPMVVLELTCRLTCSTPTWVRVRARARVRVRVRVRVGG